MFRKKQPLSLRIWHWSNAAAIFLLIGTVILRKTYLSWRNNSALLMSKAQELGVALNEEQAKLMARAILKEMWQWHAIIGFVAIGLLAFRFVIYLQNRSSAQDNSSKPLYYKLVKKSHGLFYVMLAIMGVTGMLLYWKEALGLSPELGGNVKEFHELLLWFFPAFVIAHIVGVVKAEQTKEDRGLISDMINGG